jgi:hypothetical protein
MAALTEAQAAERKKALELAADVGVTILVGFIVHAAAAAAWGGPKSGDITAQLLTMPNLITLGAMYAAFKVARHFTLIK